MKKEGFTLIELLIVVAIIAILAAIAVPNFLEAQTRSKVSKLLHEMRTIANAMDTYYLDNNDYLNWNYPDEKLPFEQGYGGYFFSEQPPNFERQGVGFLLTTPIAYMTDIPYDTFWNNATYECYCIKRATVLFIHVPGGFGYSVPMIPKNRYEWVLMSPGPNHFMYCHDPAAIYDPTNGTVSEGDIYYLHPIGFVGGYDNALGSYEGGRCTCLSCI